MKQILILLLAFSLTATGQVTFFNPSAEDVQIEQNYVQYTPETIPEGFGWSTTTSIEVQKSGAINGNVSYDGNQHFELLSRELGDNMYQELTTVPNSEVVLSFYHKKRRPNGDDIMEVLAGPDLDNLEVIGTFQVDYDEGWKLTEVEYFVPAGQWATVFMLRGVAGTTKSVGNLIDAVTLEQPSLSTGDNTLNLQRLPEGEKYDIIDMSGKVIRSGTVDKDTYNTFPRGSVFILRVDGYAPQKYFLIGNY